MRVGLVLGAGGVVGASWLIGALQHTQDATGWRAVDAERIVGTSAGAVVGALAASGVPSEYMSAYRQLCARWRASRRPSRVRTTCA